MIWTSGELGSLGIFQSVKVSHQRVDLYRIRVSFRVLPCRRHRSRVERREWNERRATLGLRSRQDQVAPNGAALINAPRSPFSIPNVPFINVEPMSPAEFPELVLKPNAFVVFCLVGDVTFDLFGV